MARKIKSAKIHSIALCKRGANRLPGLYKSDDKDDVSLETLLVTKDLQSKGELTAVVYAPNMQDSQGHEADAEAIRAMAHDFIRYGANLNLNHDGVPLDKTQARVAETFIIQKNDPRFADMRDASGAPVDVTGGWGVVIKIDDPALRARYASGEWNGVSMEGVGTFEAKKATNEFDEVVAAVAKRLGIKKETKEMTPEELSAALAKNNADLTTGIVKAISEAVPTIVKSLAAPAAEPKAPAKVEAPVFKGDPTNVADVRKHALAVKRFNIVKAHDINDPEQAEKLALALEEFDAENKVAKSDDDDADLSDADVAAGIEKTDNEEVRGLKRKLAKAQKGSKADKSKADDKKKSVKKTDDDAGDEDEDLNLTDEQREGMALGSKMAKFINRAAK